MFPMLSFGWAVLWKATLLLAMAAAASRLLRRGSAAQRHLIWASALMSLLLLPAAVWLGPQWESAALTPLEVVPVEGTVITVTGGAESWRVSSGSILLALWMTGALFCVLRYARAWQVAGGIGRRARAMASGEVLVSEEVVMPMVVGIVRPSIVLPAEAAAWPEERLDLVLAHERMHVRRRDTLTQFVGEMVCAIYWFHPLVWFALAELKRECEQACDDGVLARGTRATIYATHLVEIVKSLAEGGEVPEGGIAMARMQEIESRLKALFSPHRDRRAASARMTVVAGFVSLALLLPLASLSAPAQTKADLSGAVTDISGARVPGAEVRIEQIGGEYKTSVPTNDTGEFVFPTLAPGEYRVLILKPGFASVMKVARIKPVEATRLNFVLQLGRVSEEMSITGERPAGAAAASAATPKQIRVGGNVQATKLIQRPRPAYPAECKAEGVEGSVMLEAIISRTGTIENLRQINQDVDPRLVQAAIEAVKNWQYQPTLLNGEPVEVITAITVNFTLAK